jgi:hypothetical protein
MLKIIEREVVRQFYYMKRAVTLLERMKGAGVEPAEISIGSKRD